MAVVCIQMGTRMPGSSKMDTIFSSVPTPPTAAIRLSDQRIRISLHFYRTFLTLTHLFHSALKAAFTVLESILLKCQWVIFTTKLLLTFVCQYCNTCNTEILSRFQTIKFNFIFLLQYVNKAGIIFRSCLRKMLIQTLKGAKLHNRQTCNICQRELI